MNGQLKGMLWTKEISRDLSLRCVSDRYLILHMAPDLSITVPAEDPAPNSAQPSTGMLVSTKLDISMFLWVLNILNNFFTNQKTFSKIAHKLIKIQWPCVHVHEYPIEDLCVRTEVSWAGKSKNYIPQYLWDIITYSCLWYLFLAHTS